MTTETVQETPLCGFVPPTPGYAPCTRPRDRDGEIGHEGPCAHPLAPAPSLFARIQRQLDRGPRGWIRDWLRITSDNEQIVAYCNGLRRDHDELVKAYRQLALQHQQLAGFSHETQRRLCWHEVGPLRVSKVALDKKDQERAKREKVRLAETNGDHSEQPPAIEPVPEAERCHAIKSSDFGTFHCQLRAGHDGDHQSERETGQRAQWPQDARAATEIEPRDTTPSIPFDGELAQGSTQDDEPPPGA